MAVRGVGNMDQVGSVQGYQTYLSALTRGTDEDKAVKLSAADTVALVSAGENFIGVVRTIGEHNKLAGVQEDGWAEVGYTGSDPTVTTGNGFQFFVGGSTDGKIAMADEAFIKKTATITVATGQPSGASAADPDLVGGSILGWEPDTNQDQYIDDMTLGGDGSITITLAGNATADNKYKVAVMKAEAKWPNRYKVRSVDTVNKKVTIKLL